MQNISVPLKTDHIHMSMTELGTDIREKAVALFVQCNNDYELFTRLSLEPNHWGGTGSMIPCMQGRVKFYEALLSYFTGIHLLRHKQYILENIRRWKSMIEQQEKTHHKIQYLL